MQCELVGFGRVPCSSKLDRHHIVSKGRCLGNPKALAYVDSHWQELTAEVCNAHNAETKLADTPEARALLIERRVALFGEHHMAEVLDELRALFKDGAHDLSLDALRLGL